MSEPDPATVPERIWLDLPPDTGFGPDNLPLGIFSTPGSGRHVGVRIGDFVLDLWEFSHDEDHRTGSLNAFLARGAERWARLRLELRNYLVDEAHRGAVEPALVPVDDVTMCLPFEVADYVDFHSSRQHAGNVSRMFRPDAPALPPNWTHLPIGYHGRAGTVQVSGTPVVRPCGQVKESGAEAPSFGPTRRLDVEAEVGFVVGTPSRLGEPVSLGAFPEHVFGVCLVNDWSARDVQAWEYQPLGPFLAKSFLTTVSPWVVPLAALEVARVRPPTRDPEALPYLRDDDHPWGLDISLEVSLNGEVVSRPPFSTQYWTAAQQLAHLTVNGRPCAPVICSPPARSADRTATSGVAARALVERHRTADPGRRLHPDLPRGRGRRHDHRDRAGGRRRPHLLRRGHRQGDPAVGVSVRDPVDRAERRWRPISSRWTLRLTVESCTARNG